MRCPKCNEPLDDETVFCGNCGTQIAPVFAQGATVSEGETALIRPMDRQGPVVSRYGPVDQSFQAPQPPTQYAPNPMQQAGPSAPPFVPPPPTSTPPPQRRGNIRAIFLSSIVVLLIIAVAAGAFVFLNRKNPLPIPNGNGGAGTASGTVTFTDIHNGHTNALKIIINGLNAPPAGSQYDAWLLNAGNEGVLPLGTLTAQQGQTFTLDFAGNRNLLGAGNQIIVTQEQGTASLPTGKVILSGTFPPQAFIHIKHLLFSFPTTPRNIGLLVGLLGQAQQLDAQALILQNAVTSQNTFAIQCAAQSINNMTEGAHGPHYRPLSRACANVNVTDTSDGYGLNTYATTSAQHASLAATRPDATANIKQHANHVIIATKNIEGWLATIDHDVEGLLANPGNTGNLQEIVTLSDHVLNGVDLNNDGQVDPVPGEAGAVTAYNHGQFMAILPLTAGS
jgi:Anti-sigma-K factor rskA/zinc-ribbon domain